MTRGGAIALLIVLGAGFGILATVLLLRSPEATTKNFRGKVTPVILGVAAAAALFGAALVVFSLVLWTHKPGRPEVIRREAIFIVLGCLVVFLGGIYDDRRSGVERGLVAHFRELFRGNLTAGIVKLVAAVAGATLVAWGYRPSPVTALVGVAVMAGAADLWNLLDVRPGRALKFFIPLCLLLLMLSSRSQYALVASAALGAAAAVFPFDLTERAMMGDAGSNLFGFVAGVGLFQALPLWGLALALAAIVALHWASETVTLSRIIETTAPLRWYDRLGRKPEEPGGDRPGEEFGPWR